MATLYLICDLGQENPLDKAFLEKLYERLLTGYTVATNVNLGVGGVKRLEDISNPTHVLFISTKETYRSSNCIAEINDFLNRNESQQRWFFFKKSKQQKANSVNILPIEWHDLQDEKGSWNEEQKSIHKQLQKINNISFKEYYKQISQTSKNTVEDESDEPSRLEAAFETSYQKLLRAIENDVVPYDAFFSYSRANKDDCRSLRDRIQKQQFRIWLDEADIAPGAKSWFLEIERGIESSNTCVFFVSNHWLSSDVCHREIKYARALNKRIVIIFIDGFNEETVRDLVEKRLEGWEEFLFGKIQEHFNTDIVVEYIIDFRKSLQDEPNKVYLRENVTEQDVTGLVSQIRPPVERSRR